ncbi:MAG TPA: pyruvate formate lyase family protein [Victivallales bacterium]|nr:pyruvate formate lyase family protein [Victivallales bacterium]HRR28668.1 pyruvate formate lyase family protein [Victivallales bacterium]
MNKLIQKITHSLFNTPDSVCLDRATLITEAYSKFENLPIPIMRAKAFEHILLNMKLDLLSNPVFAGNTSSAPRSWMLCPEFSFSVDPQIEIEHSNLQDFLNGKIPDNIVKFWSGRQYEGNTGIGHLALDFKKVVDYGLLYIINSLNNSIHGLSEEQIIYRKAMAISCQAVINWAKRYSNEALKLSLKIKDHFTASCLRKVAIACQNVPAYPAKNLFEGLQSIILIHFASIIEGQGMSMSIGLPDRILAKFNNETAENSEYSLFLIQAFLLKIASNSVFGRGSKTQAITVGGISTNGDSCNSLTLTFLEAFNSIPVNDPHLFLRWHKEINKNIWEHTIKMLSNGRSMPMLINDHQVIPSLIARGVKDDDAMDYCIIGCNELGIPGKCCQTANTLAMGFNELELIDKIIRTKKFDGPNIINDILNTYEDEVFMMTSSGIEARYLRSREYAEKNPFPFCSACCSECPEKGLDFMIGMPYSNIYGIYIRGTSNAVNVLSTIQNLVINNKRYLLTDLISAIDKKDPHVLKEILETPKWGNDDDNVDRLAILLNLHRDNALRRAAKKANLPPLAVCHVVRSLHFLDGKRIGPTLDGRPKQSPVADSIGAVLGTAKNGPTATLNSVLKLEATRYFPGIYNLNITLPAGAQSSPHIIQALTTAFFKDGGQELQINVLDAEILRDAQRNPAKYQNLVVRIAGLNARFIELSIVEQEELIRRAEFAIMR